MLEVEFSLHDNMVLIQVQKIIINYKISDYLIVI